MKSLKKFIPFIIPVIVLISCDEYIKEENFSSPTVGNVLTNQEAFEELVNGMYMNLKKATKINQLDFLGTDIYTRQELVPAAPLGLNEYVNLKPSNSYVKNYWRAFYQVIKDCNEVLKYAENIADLDSQVKAKGIGQAKVIRAYCYFHLAEQFGDVPLVLKAITTAETNFPRTKESKIYDQIIDDVKSSIKNLETTPKEFGRISQGAAKHLLAKMYLTRGYKAYKSDSDFTTAAKLLEEIINSGTYHLVDTYKNLIDYKNQVNSEVIFSIQYTTDALINAEGNNKHRYFKFAYEVYPGLERSSRYGRAYSAYEFTHYYYNLYKEEDTRDDVSLTRVLYATIDQDKVNKGDTVVYFPKVKWTEQKKKAKRYLVVNEDEYFITPSDKGAQSMSHFPLCFKFDDPDAPYENKDNGTRDAVIYRLGETYLMAAEAEFQLGNLNNAAGYLNKIRERAAYPGKESAMKITSSDITIDFILDEYAREMSGETSRWMELKRTKKLKERLKHNNHAQVKNNFQDFNYLRPIPQSIVDLSRGTTQNPGY